MSQRPFETMNVSSSKPQFSLSLFNEKSVFEFRHQPLHNGCSTIGRIIFDNKNMKVLIERKDFADNILNILLFVIGWYND